MVMAVWNVRGAGRKPSISEEMLQEIRMRRKRGESVTMLAQDYGVSRQTMSAYLNSEESKDVPEIIYRTYKKWVEVNREFRNSYAIQDYLIRMEYMCEDELCSSILINFAKKEIAVVNHTNDVIHRAFGVKVKPDWEDFEYFLESRCFPRGRDYMKDILRDLGLDNYDPLAIIEKTKGRMAEDKQWIRLKYYRPEKTEEMS